MERLGEASLVKCRKRYSFAAVWIAHNDLLVAQQVARIKLATAVLGTALFLVSVNSLLPRSSFSLFGVIIFLILFCVNGVLVLPAAARSDQPWKRLGLLAAIFFALALAFVPVMSGLPGILFVSSASQAIALAALTVAGFDIFGLALARVAFWYSEQALTSQYANGRRNDMYAILRSGWLVADLTTDRELLDSSHLRLSMFLLDNYLDTQLGKRNFYASATVRNRYAGAARAVRELNVWLALPQETTASQMQQRAADLASALISGQYHYLPYSDFDDTQSENRADPKRALRSTGRILKNLLAAVLPAGVYLLWRIYGLGFPPAVDQWLGSLALLWLILRLVSLLDPNYTSAWREMRGMLPGGGKDNA